MEMVNPLLKVEDVMAVLNVSRALVYRLIEAGELRAVRIGRAVRVKPADLDLYIESNQTVNELNG